MLKIQCCNEKCTAPERSFPWNERPHLWADGRLATEEDGDAVSFIERCPYCGTRNKIRVTNLLDGWGKGLVEFTMHHPSSHHDDYS